MVECPRRPAMPRPPLPIDAVLPRLREALAAAGAVVLRAPTGAGKTTRVPPAVLADLAPDRSVVVVEPRRVAARAAARRMAAENGWELGREVGYQVRFDRRAGAATRLLVVTEGILVQRLQRDPFLEGVGAVLFDEFHERRLDADLALAMAARVRREVRDDLRIAVMSATLDPAPLTAFLDDCPAVESRGALHAVEIEHLDPTERRLPPDAVGSRRPGAVAALTAWGVRRLLARTSGDLLAFLPGVGEIERTAEALADLPGHGVAVQTLYGDLPPEAQDAVLAGGGRRRVVLATNVAETSVTLAGIEGVVDSGWVRRLRFDPASGLDRLELARISRASATQRAGRAGRLGPGRCLRLWSEHEDRGLAERETPEVHRVDLSGAVLELFAWGETDPARFPWFEAPGADRLERAVALLARLGALAPAAGGGHAVTPLGRALAAVPAHPRLARLLVEGRRLGAGEAAALAAAVLAERFPLRRPRGAAPPPSRSDVLDAVEAVEAFAAGRGRAPRLDLAAARFALRARDQLAAVARRLDTPVDRLPAGGRGEAVLRALLAAYPDRVARRREPGSPRAVAVGGGGLVLGEESAVRHAELFVAVDVAARRGGGGGAEARVRRASAVEPGWLPAARVHRRVEVAFDPARERVVAHRRSRYEDLVLAEDEVPVPADGTAAEVLAAAAAADIGRALDLESPAVAAFLARLRSLRAWRPELGLPELAEAELVALLPALCAGHRSFAELRRVDLEAVLRGLLTAAQSAALDREAPERLEVPSGSRLRLAYEPGRSPVLAARIQELFGLEATPRVAGGRVPVLLHLLAPNGRPQQVTQDLASFWENTYPEVRRELAGRYPKHAWPEDPRRATPERRPRRR